MLERIFEYRNLDMRRRRLAILNIFPSIQMVAGNGDASAIGSAQGGRQDLIVLFYQDTHAGLD